MINSKSYKNIGHHFQEMHIKFVWDELQERFGFPIKAWKKAFNDYLGKQPRNSNDVESFLKFGSIFINPVLNQILLRNSLHGTFNNLVEYILKKNNVMKDPSPYSRD